MGKTKKFEGKNFTWKIHSESCEKTDIYRKSYMVSIKGDPSGHFVRAEEEEEWGYICDFVPQKNKSHKPLSELMIFVKNLIGSSFVFYCQDYYCSWARVFDPAAQEDIEELLERLSYCHEVDHVCVYLFSENLKDILLIEFF